MLMILVPIILLSFIRHLKVLAWFSILANIATVVSLGIIFYYVFQVSPFEVKSAITGDDWWLK